MRYIGILAGIGLLLAVTGTAGANSWYQDGGDRLVALQNDDGGWDWPLDAGDPTTSSPANTIGPIAMGLAQAYRETGDAAMLTALGNPGAGGFLLAKTNNFSPPDGYMAAELDAIFGGTTYVDHVTANFYDPLAAGTYDRNGVDTNYTTAEYVSFIDTLRAGQGIPNLGAWDIGMGLVGAVAAGADTTAWIAGTKTSVTGLVGDYNNSYPVLGLAGGLYGLASIGQDLDAKVSGGYLDGAQTLIELGDKLASFQAPAGGFAKYNDYTQDAYTGVQETAYSLLALYEIDPVRYATEIATGQNWLISVQLGTGGWGGTFAGASEENNEVTGEALWAVPEPATLSLLALGGAFALIRRRRK